MEAFAFALVGAILLDLGLYWLWRRRNPRRADSEPSTPRSDLVPVIGSEEQSPADLSGPEQKPRGKSTVQLIIEAAEGSHVRLQLEDVSAKESVQVELTSQSNEPVHFEIGEQTRVDLVTGPIPESMVSGRSSGSSRFGRAFERIAQLARTQKLASLVSGLYSRIWSRPVTLEQALFSAALILYSATRFIQLEDFPIYFFADEAVQAVLAGDLIRDGLHDFTGTFLPTYFQNVALFNLSLSVYLQVIPQLLFENSVFITRAASVLVTILGAAGVGLILRNIYESRHWWAGVLLLSITPAWFLHSRTAFETVLMVSFYIWFFYFYLLYRARSPKYIYPALICGALVFYSYSPGQMIIVGTGLLLLISDFSYHWQNRRKTVWGVALLGMLVLPYIRFQLQHGEATYFHLRMLNSYWLSEISLAEKIGNFVHFYTRALSPAYWYFPHDDDLVRHVMKGYGHILPYTLPFALTGLVASLRKLGESRYRAIILILLAAPLGTALVGIGLTRILVFVFPATLLTLLGIEVVLRQLPDRIPVEARGLALMGLLAAINLFMWRDSLANAPTWYRDYGLYGMQYGAIQLFSEVDSVLEDEPDTQVYISPVWANGADILLRFFMPGDSRVQLLNVDGLLYEVVPDMDSKLFVLTQSEYAMVADSPKFSELHVDTVLTFPDGTDGFYFTRLRYAPEAAQLIEAELIQLNEPVTELLLVGDRRIQITHPPFDAGRIEDVFDGDVFTLGRTREANPAIFTLAFEAPEIVSGITLTTGSMDIDLEVKLFQGEASEPVIYQQTFTGLPPDPTVELLFDDGPTLITKLEISVTNMMEGPKAKIHIREIVLQH
jgi:hypothetical protein